MSRLPRPRERRVSDGRRSAMGLLLGAVALSVVRHGSAQPEAPASSTSTGAARSSADARQPAPRAAMPPSARIDDAEQPLVIVLRSPEHSPLTARVRGQLVDLDVHLVTDITPLEADLAAQRAAAERLGERHAADLVVWLRSSRAREPGATSPGHALVVVWFSSSDDDYVREVGTSIDRLDSGEDSAGLEVTALTVRSAARSRMIERAAGARAADDPPPERAAAATPSPEPKPPPTGATTTEPRRSDPSTQPTRRSEPYRSDALRATGASLRFELGLGVEAGWSGLNLNIAPRLHAGVRFGAVRTVGVLSIGLPGSATTGDVDFDTRRDRLGVQADVEVFETRGTSWSPAVRVNLERSSRTTAATPAQVLAASSDRFTTVVLGAGALFESRLHPRHSLLLQAMADWHPVRTDFTVRDSDGHLVSSTSPWRVAPSLTLGWAWSP